MGASEKGKKFRGWGLGFKTCSQLPHLPSTQRTVGFHPPTLNPIFYTLDTVLLGAPRETRTPDLRIRSPALYPTELWARGVNEGTRTLNPWSHSPVLCH
jgi:hypothetical protein